MRTNLSYSYSARFLLIPINDASVLRRASPHWWIHRLWFFKAPDSPAFFCIQWVAHPWHTGCLPHPIPTNCLITPLGQTLFPFADIGSEALPDRVNSLFSQVSSQKWELQNRSMYPRMRFYHIKCEIALIDCQLDLCKAVIVSNVLT